MCCKDEDNKMMGALKNGTQTATWVGLPQSLLAPHPFPLQNGYFLFIILKIDGVQNLVGISWFSGSVFQQGKLPQPKHHGDWVRLLPVFELAHLQLICIHL